MIGRSLLSMLALAGATAFADPITIGIGTDSALSSLTLGASASDAVIGTTSITFIQVGSNIGSFTNGSFSFTTSPRGTVSGLPSQDLTPGGTWLVSGTVTVGSSTFSGTLIKGTFTDDTTLENSGGWNSFNSIIKVTGINQQLASALGLTPQPSSTGSVLLTRDGAWSADVFSDINSVSSTTGSINIDGVPSTGVPEPMELSLLLTGGLGSIALLRNRRRKN